MYKNLKWVLLATIIVTVTAIFGFWPPLDIKDKDGNVVQAGKINLGLDLQGGMHLVLKVDTSKLSEKERKDAPERALEVVRNRIDQFGVKEVSITRQGINEIVVQLPGVTDRERAISLIGMTALLEFRLVSSDPEKHKQALEGNVPEGYELTESEDGEKILIEKKADVTGADLVSASVKFDQTAFNQPIVAITFNKDGAKKFAQVTGDNVGQRLAIVLDGIVKSAPVIKDRIPGGEAVIQGRFTPQEANDLAIVLRAGSLPAPIIIEEERTVGPLLGQDSIIAGVKAIAIGALFVFAFILIYYLLAGVVAVVSLILDLILILGIMGYFHFTLTLPGMAGLILTLGMAVDANVLIYERIREELALGKTLRSAISLGFDKALSAIVDSNLTTLIAAVLLFQFGTGPIRGFATTLTIGIFASMFTALIVCKALFQLLTYTNIKTIKMQKWIGETKIDFIGKRKIFYALSMVIIIAGLVIFGARGDKNYGVDFSGGTLQQFEFKGAVDMVKIRQAVEEAGVKGASIQKLGGEREVLVRTAEESPEKISNKLKEVFGEGSFEVMRVEKVGPSIGAQLRKNAVKALLFGLLGIMTYVAFRFKHWEYGLAGIIALFHDVLAVVGAMALTGREFDLTIVAAILTIAGYSINDTVVIYDRIRENMGFMRKMKFADIINLSVNQTLSRTIFTTFATMLTAIALFVWGGVVLNAFAFCLLVGFISGVYSTVFIASPLLIAWHRGRR